jgi:hypothetical protein
MRYPVLLMSIALAACATTGPGDDSIALDTYSRGQPLPGANCTVSTASGSWNVVTPATVQVGSASGDLRVVCNKDGYRTSELLFKPAGTSSGSSLGLGVGGGGGHVGVGLGMSVPITLGSRGYPNRVSVELNPH